LFRTGVRNVDNTSSALRQREGKPYRTGRATSYAWDGKETCRWAVAGDHETPRTLASKTYTSMVLRKRQPMQPTHRLRRSAAGLVLFYLACLLIGGLAVVVLIAAPGFAAPGMILLAALALVVGPLIATYRERLREIIVGPEGIHLDGFGLNRDLSWADMQAVDYLNIGGPASVIFAAFALREGVAPPRIGGGPGAVVAAKAFGAGRPAFAVRISEFPGGASALHAALRAFAPSDFPIDQPGPARTT
jgi:hypothetical protein